MREAGRTLVIGGASAALGDWNGAVPQLLTAPKLDYLVMDYMAELTSTFLARAKQRNPDGGYAHHFTEAIWRRYASRIAAARVKVVTNAGGLNPAACVRELERINRDLGLSLRIAVVDGDDVASEFDTFAHLGSAPEFGPVVKPDHKAVLSANVYLGAAPICAALAAGADVVITGRVVDSALTLGPLVHEFGWGGDDFDRLAAGSLAGHILECGAQATGGLFTDWEDVEDWAHIGYPLVECDEHGDFVVTKPEGTGGLCTTATVAEQIVYEIGDPARYVLPDVVCDFTEVTLTDAGDNRVRVSGARGRPPTGLDKVCVAYRDGWHAVVLLPVIGIDAQDKAERQAAAILERFAETLQQEVLGDVKATRVEILGAEASYGRRARRLGSREVVCKIGIEHEQPEALDLFLSELSSHAVSMAVGSAGWFGNAPARAPVVRVASYLLPSDRVHPRVRIGSVEAPLPTNSRRFQGETSDLRRTPAERSAPVSVGTDSFGPTVTVPLVRLAHGRSGDKGNHFNVGIIARQPEYLPYIRRALTESAVADFFAEEFDNSDERVVERFDLPGLHALNFLCRNALGGASTASLRLDVLAKGKAQQLLEFEVTVPERLLRQDT